MATDITKKSDKDLVKDLNDKRETLQTHVFGVAGSATKNVKEAQSLKKDIARIKTEIRRRELAA